MKAMGRTRPSAPDSVKETSHGIPFPRHSVTTYFFLWSLLVAVILSSPIKEAPTLRSIFSRFGLNGSRGDWASLLTIDPSKILSAMTQHGGLVLPKSVEKELQVLKHVCHCDQAKLDVLNRELEIRNFTVAIPGARNRALRVGRIYVQWDSYRLPCVQVEVEDVDILVEFLNLALTKTNWNELKDAGFPPEMVYAEETTGNMSSSSNTFVRIGSVDLSGNVRLKAHSRPLGESLCSDLVLDLGTLDELNTLVRAESERNRAKGRPGCTTDQLYDLLQSYFSGKLRALLKTIAVDLASSHLNPLHESVTIEGAKEIVMGARETLLSYAFRAQKKTEERIQKRLATHLGKWGLDQKQLENIRKVSKAAMDWANKNEGLAESYWDEFSAGEKTATYATGGKIRSLHRDEGRAREQEEFFFPDW